MKLKSSLLAIFLLLQRQNAIEKPVGNTGFSLRYCLLDYTSKLTQIKCFTFYIYLDVRFD